MDPLIIAKQVALSLLARRKKWIVFCAVVAAAIFVPVAYYMSIEPQRHRTTALILIESRPQPAPMFQEFSPYRPLDIQLAILRSRSLGEAVLEALPRASVEDLIENPYNRDYLTELQNRFRRWKGEEPIVESPQRRALAELQRARVAFYPQGGSGLLTISADASKPRVALDIANTYIEVLLARTRSFNVDDTRVTRDFLEQQNAQVSQALAAADSKLREFTIARGGIRPPTRNAETVARLSQAEQALAEVQANKNVAQGRLSAMKAKLDALPAPPPPAMAGPSRPAPTPPAVSPRIGLLRNKLAALEKQLFELETVYTERHPRVTLTKTQIDEVKQELGDAVKDSAPVAAATVASSVPSEDRRAFADVVAALETTVLALGAQEEALREQTASLRKSLSGLSRDEQEFARLSGEVESNRRLQAILADKITGVRMREQGEMRVVKIIDPPSPPVASVNQKRVKFLTMAAMLSLVVGLGIPAAVEYFNRPIQSEEDVRGITGAPVLASVPHIQSRRAPLFQIGAPAENPPNEEHFLFSEAFRRLRVELQLLGRDMPLHRILVASALPGEGKSTVVVNLGLALGEIGRHVILADADFHRPTLHRAFRTANTKGFSDLLAGIGDLHDVMNPVSEGVWLTPRGGSSTALTRTGLGSQRLAQVIDSMAAEAEYVLLDSSPILLIPDNLFMAAAVDAVLLVVQAGVTRPRDLLRAKQVIDKAGTPIVGVVLNRVPRKHSHRYYSYYRTYTKAGARA
jgi:capsular exopolysaccharide synthesis family protein